MGAARRWREAVRRAWRRLTKNGRARPSGEIATSRGGVAAVAVGLAALGIVGWTWFENAWITDDAFITFRSIEQLLAGNGLRFNVHERVQSFTHPLWLAALLPLRLAGVPLPAAALLLGGLAFAGALIVLGWPVRDRPRRALVAGVVVLASRTWIDFSSSGLETPLSLLLVLAFAWGVLRTAAGDGEGESTTPVVLTAALLLLTRLDHAPFVAPALGLVVARRRRASRGRWWRELAVGLLPLAVWSAAAFLYYGSPFPNTVHAKLGAGVPRSELVLQGLRYLAVTARWDLLLVPMLGAAAWVAYRGRAAERALVAGVALHLGYVVAIGGDFMAGRFLVPAAAAALALVVWRAPDTMLLAGAALAAALLALSPQSALRAGAGAAPAWPRGAVGKAGVVDEKADREGSEWLRDRFRAGWGRPMSEPLAAPRVVGTLGRPGYRAHPRQILVDRFALADPFLARLRYEPPWQPGHFRRRLPAGYLESVATGVNHLADPQLARLFDEVREVVSGPLGDLHRLGLAARLLLPRSSRGTPLDRRCPALRVEAPGEPAAPASRLLRLDLQLAVEGRRLVARGVAPLGERAEKWQVALGVSPLPERSGIRCRPAGDRAPLDIVVELDYASASDARAALANGVRSALTRAVRKPAPATPP